MRGRSESARLSWPHLALVILALLGSSVPGGAASPRPGPTAKAAVARHGRVYANKVSGYRVRYPVSARPLENTRCPGINGEVSLGTCFVLADTVGFGAQVGVTVETGPCSLLQKAALADSLSNVRFNGVLFKRRVISEGTAGTHYGSTEYTTVRHDSCYALVLTLRLVAAGNYDEPERSRIERIQHHGVQRAEKLFREMVSSFRFTR
jgi:hypothetical protein